MKITIVNKGKRPEGVHTVDGSLAWVPPGRQRTVEIDGDTLPRIERIAGLAVTQRDGAEEDDLQAVLNPPPAGEPDEAEQAIDDLLAEMTDEALRDSIEQRTRKRPHPNAKRETLIERLKEALKTELA